MIGLLTIKLFNNKTRSLKEKRRIISSLKYKLNKQFNVAVGEINDQDKWQKAELAIVSVSNSASKNSSLLQRVVHFIKKSGDWEILDFSIREVL